MRDFPGRSEMQTMGRFRWIKKPRSPTGRGNVLKLPPTNLPSMEVTPAPLPSPPPKNEEETIVKLRQRLGREPTEDEINEARKSLMRRLYADLAFTELMLRDDIEC
jgi:hypothetical protein